MKFKFGRKQLLLMVVIGIAVIMFWKGIWTVLDIVLDQWLFKNDTLTANMVSAGLGIAILVILGGLAYKRIV